MNYQNPFINPFGYGQQLPQQYMQPGIQQQAPAQQQISMLNGRNGAMQLPMGPNSSGWYLDQSGEMAWLITTDGAGYKTVTPYDVSVHQDEPKKELTDLETRVKRLEENMFGGKKNGNTGNFAATGKKSNEPGGGAD